MCSTLAFSLFSQFTKFVWGSRAPPRVHFFAWLLVQECIQCRANLMKKHILDDGGCPVCGATEDSNHIIFGCSFATAVWRTLGIDTTNAVVRTLWTLGWPPALPVAHYDSFLLLTCWLLWKHRNDIVFNDASPSLPRFWRTCKEEARLWSHRLPLADRWVTDAWCTLFSFQ